ncbi:MAG TPA: dihydrolipoamide acetyltransferase family protein [Chloroflexota bacterium]|nr:dihydrolipoamide acetyltransferase family protein [Chloroflexota bacterium]
MSTPVTMPQLGESVAEGTIGRWLKRPGDHVERDEPLAEIITDKVNAELPSPIAGQVEALLVDEGATVAVGTPIARIAAADAAAPSATARQADESGAEPAAADVGMFAGTLESLDAPIASGAAPARPRDDAAAVAPSPAAGASDRRVRSSPLVRRLAEEHQVDLALVPGTGLGGRVTKDDILNYIAGRQPVAAEMPPAAAPAAEGARATPAAAPVPAPAPQPAAPAPAATQPAAAPTGIGGVAGAAGERLPLTPMRRMIAEHLTRTHQTVPTAWTMVEVDVTGLVRWRERVRDEFQRREGVALSYLAPFIQAAVEALKQQPLLNALWADDHIQLRRRIHVGVAVALDDGLIVPVLHDADERNLVGIARGLADLIARARAGTLAPSDVQGATFTVNNTGAFGSVVSVPIVPHGQSAILTMEAIVKRAVVVDDAIAIRSMMNVCLTFDHRVLDGAAAGHFLQGVKQRLESYPPSAYGGWQPS